jgi:Ni/Co efflux regulator RcnB
MLRKAAALLAAVFFTAVTLAPVAEARDHRRDGYHSGRHYRDHDRRRHHHHRDNDALAAGAVGLVLGLAIGAIASQPSEPRVQCRDNYQRCPPPPRYEDDRYYEGGGAYERDYGYAPGEYYEEEPQRMCSERQWDRYANRYVTVDVPC